MARNFQEEEVLLKYNDRFLDNATLMREINDHGDNLIAMEAVKRSDLPARTPRQSLQPSNVPGLAKLASPAAEAVKSSLESRARYVTPYARFGTPSTLGTPGSAVSASTGDRRRPGMNANFAANRLPTKSPLSERSRNPQGIVDGPHDVVGHREPTLLETKITAVDKARTKLAQDPIHTAESLPASVRPNLSALAQGYSEGLKRESDWLNDGMSPISHETTLN